MTNPARLPGFCKNQSMYYKRPNKKIPYEMFPIWELIIIFALRLKIKWREYL